MGLAVAHSLEVMPMNKSSQEVIMNPTWEQRVFEGLQASEFNDLWHI